MLKRLERPGIEFILGGYGDNVGAVFNGVWMQTKKFRDVDPDSELPFGIVHYTNDRSRSFAPVVEVISVGRDGIAIATAIRSSRLNLCPCEETGGDFIRD